MQEVILYIKPQFRNNVSQDYVKVDMFSDENVTLTQVIQDVRHIDKVFTDYSQTFSLPASKINNKLFQHWYNPDIDGFDSNIQSEAIIELNYQPFKSGKIQLQEVKMKQNKPSVYKVTFYGKTVSLNNTFGEDQLDDLVWLNNFTFNNTPTKVRDGLNLGLDFTVDSVSYTDAIIHPLISREQRYILNSGGDNSNPGNISAANVTQDNQRGVMPEDLKPAIKATLIIKAIEEQYGITFKSSEFFDSTEFSNLYLWLNRKVGKYSFVYDVDVSTTYTCSDIILGSCTFFSTNAAALFDNGKWKIQNTTTPDLHDFGYKTTVTPTATYATTNYTMEVVDILNDNVIGTLTGSGTNFLQINLDTITNPLPVGAKRELVTRVIADGNFEFASSIDTYVVDGNIFGGSGNLYYATHTSVSTTIPTTTGDLLPTQEIPEMKILDFLKGLFKQFNLTAFLNDSDEIVVKTLDDFYGDSTTTHDISQYVKTDENTVSEALPFTDINFQYPEAQTKLAQAYSNIHNRQYGKLDYQANASRGSQYKVDSPFGHMLYERLQDLNDDSYTEVQYGLSVNESDNEVLPKPLLFYGIYQSSIHATDAINFLDSTRPEDGGLAPAGTNYSLTDYWMPHNANELGTASTAPAFNLNFGSEINSYTLTDYGGTNNSLFQKFYQNYILRVFNTKTRIFKYKAILPLKFLLTYSLADKVFVNGRAFTINKITTKLQTGESSLELLNEPT